ncbi:MAG: DNA polymerase Y family protein [Spirochaetia bacterium]
MPRPACVNLPELSLQVLFRRRPQWREHPAAVVASSRPLARIEALNRPAAALGIRRGMRYATALSLASQLRADIVSQQDLAGARDEVRQILSDFSPDIERCSFDPEIFWMDTRGLLPLFDSRREWADLIKSRLAEHGFHANIAVGFTRFGTFAWAKRRKKVRVFETPEEEATAAVETPLSLLPVPPRILELTESLGLRTVGEFTALPREDIRKRLGAEALAIYRFATDRENLPLQAEPIDEEPITSLSPLAPIRSTGMLEHAVFRLLAELLAHVTQRGESVRELLITLEFEGGTQHTERITPAHPSRRVETLQRLVHLRLENLTLSAAVIRIQLEADRVEVSFKQEELFVADGGRDLTDAEKALAAVRAELGDEAVAGTRLFEEYRPEEQFAFEADGTLHPPAVGGSRPSERADGAAATAGPHGAAATRKSK